MPRPTVSRPEPPGPRMPESVLRRRPAVVVSRPAPPPPPPPAPARPPGSRGLPAPHPVRGRRQVMPLGLAAVILVFLGLFTVATGIGAATGFNLRDFFKGPDKPPPRAFPVLSPSAPQRLMIPAINVAAPVLNVGFAKDGSVGTPPLKRHNEVGWFDQGPTPGQFGPALIVGHADTRTGPSVFHDLGRLKPGQRIEVLREDNRVAVFRINSVEHFDKEKLPKKRVYGDYSRPSLRLVTCGGSWLGGERGYSDNVIVFASLTGTKDP
ncbi:class F sortase [Actinoplanes sp. NPDC049668]|uniref:class F sortase n=1 Tax=unclassified Actinoplanes TaxID=2626549 RepID=UPI0033A76F56